MASLNHYRFPVLDIDALSWLRHVDTIEGVPLLAAFIICHLSFIIWELCSTNARAFYGYDGAKLAPWPF